MSKYNWDQIRTQVKAFRARAHASYPLHALATVKDFHIDGNQRKIYFLSNNQAIDGTLTRHLTLYQVDYHDIAPSLDEHEPLASQEHPYIQALSKRPILEWSPVFSQYLVPSESNIPVDAVFPSPSDISSGLYPIESIAHYQVMDDQILFCSGNAVYLGTLGQIPILLQQQQPTNSSSATTLIPPVMQHGSPSESPPSPNMSVVVDSSSPKHQARYTRQQNGSSSSSSSDNNNHNNTTTSSTLGSTTHPTFQSPVRNDAKLGGVNNNLIAFVRNRDIWVSTTEGYEVQLTTSSLQTDDPTLSSGTSEHVMQEEFQRYTGYYWAPVSASSTTDPINRILYLETSEKDVDVVVIVKPRYGTAIHPERNAAEPVRYPRAGTPNAVSDLQIVEFGSVIPETTTRIVRKRLWHGSIKDVFPWCEYIVRFGWLPDGQSVWVQILSRDQKHMAVLRVACDQFITESDYRQQQQHTTQFEILWEETSSIWINVADAFYFLKSSTPECVEFIWHSELSGFRHLYYISKRSSAAVSSVTQLTSGDWCVTDHPIYVDEQRHLVYFMARKDTPLESHLYVTHYRHHHDQPHISRLTRLGFSHSVAMDTSAGVFIDCFSSLHHTQSIILQHLEYHDNNKLPTVAEDRTALVFAIPHTKEDAACWMMEDTEHTLRSSPRVLATPTPSDESGRRRHSSNSGSFEYWHALKSGSFGMYDAETQTVPAGEIFSFINSDGVRLYGYLYKPRYYEPGTSYPTILYIYGGPKTQMVTNDFRLARLQRYLMSVHFGFAVVVIDGRGSSDRGLAFESHIHRRLGSVEIDDQIQGLYHVHDAKVGAEATLEGNISSVIDLDRVGITGWSYGGYLSLMGLAQRPDVFKMAIAGAPVTQWELYDSAYTERYLGLPETNRAGYKTGSVLNWVDQFPDSEHRLLIAHGLIDENVHFVNTEVLVSKLVKHNKPHYLQVYPTEKHGLRHASVNEHFETLSFFWFVNYL